MCFVATVQRSNVTVTVRLSVGLDYPATKPLMVVSLLWAGVLHTALNDEAIRVCTQHTCTLGTEYSYAGLHQP